jgi:hypothetical protein
MTPDDVRTLALSLEATYESRHMGHPDFRVGKKGIFATLRPDEQTSVLRLPLEMAETLAREDQGRKIVSRYAGMGWLSIDLNQADREEFESLLELAWELRKSR